jgi:hypothetical protein
MQFADRADGAKIKILAVDEGLHHRLERRALLVQTAAVSASTGAEMTRALAQAKRSHSRPSRSKYSSSMAKPNDQGARVAVRSQAHVHAKDETLVIGLAQRGDEPAAQAIKELLTIDGPPAAPVRRDPLRRASAGPSIAVSAAKGGDLCRTRR